MYCGSFVIKTLFHAQSWTLRPNQWKSMGLFSWTWIYPGWVVKCCVLFIWYQPLHLFYSKITTDSLSIYIDLWHMRCLYFSYMSFRCMVVWSVCKKRFLCIILIDWHPSDIHLVISFLFLLFCKCPCGCTSWSGFCGLYRWSTIFWVPYLHYISVWYSMIWNFIFYNKVFWNCLGILIYRDC